MGRALVQTPGHHCESSFGINTSHQRPFKFYPDHVKLRKEDAWHIEAWWVCQCVTVGQDQCDGMT